MPEAGKEGVEVGPEVSEEVGMARVEGGTGVSEGMTEEVAERTSEVIVEGDEGVTKDERTPEMTNDDVVFVSKGATEVSKCKKRANDAPKLMVVNISLSR
ncbi:Hypothetical predicted protein [Olea europaea subsp. europaea]|uniref:Uncharacterized protein n=1 Tax=Olea europaea subsp. europaea TaxID=158383 RepID=A0A8S0UWV0_OLEEU|nr:Hypothetical predicted protein [Olea europaea subsp. europaea]